MRLLTFDTQHGWFCRLCGGNVRTAKSIVAHLYQRHKIVLKGGCNMKVADMLDLLQDMPMDLEVLMVGCHTDCMYPVCDHLRCTPSHCVNDTHFFYVQKYDDESALGSDFKYNAG